jgi:hypothetical protein
MEQQRLEFLHTDVNNVLNLMRLTIWIRLRLVDRTCTRFFSDNSLLERMEIGFAEHQKQVCMYVYDENSICLCIGDEHFFEKKKIDCSIIFWMTSSKAINLVPYFCKFTGLQIALDYQIGWKSLKKT